METGEIIKTCRRLSVGSFLIGTGLLGYFFFTNSYDAALLSLLIIVLLGSLNLFYLIKVILRGRKEQENRKQIWKTAAIMCLNIPIAVVYFWFVSILDEMVILRLKNNTELTVTKVMVTGCGEFEMGTLRPGDTRIQWIPLARDCFEQNILVEYEAQGIVQREIIYPYVLHGERINHGIGDVDNLVITE